MSEPIQPVPPSEALPLPGLEAQQTVGTSDLETAVRRTLAELQRRGHLDEADAGKTQLAVEMSRIITHKRASGRTSTVGNDARVLMEILDAWKEETTTVDEELRATLAEWGEEVNRDPTEVRDTT